MSRDCKEECRVCPDAKGSYEVCLGCMNRDSKTDKCVWEDWI